MPATQSSLSTVNSDPAKKFMKELAFVIAKTIAERAVVGLVAAVI
jgi:hypothetical protein